MIFRLLPICIAITLFAWGYSAQAQETGMISGSGADPVVDLTLLPNQAQETSDEASGAVSAETPDISNPAPEQNYNDDSRASALAGGLDEALSPDDNAMFTPPVDVNEIPSLFFTKWEHDLLIGARKGLTTRPSGAGPEIVARPDGMSLPESPREVSLGGITYLSSTNWAIWLNGMHITPTAIPSEVMDIKVYKDRIELDWLDRSANQIYPIRLRPHEKFNLDTRMFLPADGS